MDLTEVSNILWRERLLLDLLVFKLEAEGLVLAAGPARWLERATREVETVLTDIKLAELERAILVSAYALEVGSSESPSLRELSASVAAPWDTIFDDHRRALLGLAREVDSIATSNRSVLRRDLQDARETLAEMGDLDLGEYDATGAAPDRSRALRLADEAM